MTKYSVREFEHGVIKWGTQQGQGAMLYGMSIEGADMTAVEMVGKAERNQAPIVALGQMSGHDPARYPLYDICREAHQLGILVHVATCGLANALIMRDTHMEQLDYVSVHRKAGVGPDLRTHPTWLRMADEIVIMVGHRGGTRSALDELSDEIQQHKLEHAVAGVPVLLVPDCETAMEECLAVVKDTALPWGGDVVLHQPLTTCIN